MSRPEIRGNILQAFAVCESCFNEIADGDVYEERKTATCHPATNYRIMKICKDCSEK